MWDDQKKSRGWGGSQVGQKPKVQKISSTWRRHACARSLMLMCGEGQRWCIRWRVKLLWVTLSCRVSLAQTLVLPRCLSGDTRAFLLQNPGICCISSIVDDGKARKTWRTTFSVGWPRWSEMKGYLRKKKSRREKVMYRFSFFGGHNKEVMVDIRTTRRLHTLHY